MEKEVLFSARTQAYLETIREIVKQLPGTEEYICFGTPAFRTKKRLIARLQEDGNTLSVYAADRDIWINQYPEMFFVTPHFYNYPAVLLKLSVIPTRLLRQVITEAWQQTAPKSMLKQHPDHKNMVKLS
jgi:hypothetical protein